VYEWQNEFVKAKSWVVQLKIWKDTRGQDMMEYACFMAAIVLLYAAFTPSVATGVQHVITQITNNLSTAAHV
jgi:Flp pilus assembly pilin Flp